MKESSNTFYVFDLDRTLFDTVRAANELIALAAQRPEPAAKRAVAEIQALLDSGVSFVVRDVMIDVLGEEITNEIHDQFVDQANASELMLPGAQDVLTFASKTSAGWGIVTYGSEEAQLVKLRAAQLINEPFMVTKERDKGLVMQTWQQNDGTFILPDEFGGHAIDDLVFVDDHLYSFESLPSGVTGYWVSPERVARTEGACPETVICIDAIAAVIEQERARRNIDEA